ncbi:hypothetical protein DVH24_006916 [Malus domestica]|uniref:RNase H type-1 domain-containing protein n=1 Tax=Malus domestica TaxID=3750 RepID=A0A498JC80_MALDO|nr:hypothetical protein DVH24_006916 [Malus domestica]
MVRLCGGKLLQLETVWFGRRLGVSIIGALQCPLSNLSPIGHIIEDMKALLPTITENICTHVRRQANIIAHCLARYCLSIGSNCQWLYSPPPFIVDLLVEESMEMDCTVFIGFWLIWP